MVAKHGKCLTVEEHIKNFVRTAEKEDDISEIQDIHGIGEKMITKLQLHDINTLLDLAQLDYYSNTVGTLKCLMQELNNKWHI